MEQGMPLLGDSFPEMKVKTTHGMMDLPKDLKGKWFVLFSHPGDFTPVCTTEFVAFAKMSDKFKELGCELVGLSIDQVFSHIKWVEWIEEKLGVKIPFPIIADDMGKVGTALGMIHPGKGANTVRAVFIVDAEAKIRLILYYPQEIGRNMDEILRVVKALQTSDKNGVALPANWPNNDLVKDHVIIPPASNVEEAEKRKKPSDFECFDWWFCHRRL
jgi:peroxiredoxin (alkyl hydroperoxide reductase subunit C)